MSVIAHTGKKGTASTVTTDAIDTTGASTIYLAVASYAGANWALVTDNKSNVFKRRSARPIDATHGQIQILEVRNPSVGSGHTFTVASGGGGNNFPAVCVIALSEAITWSQAESSAASAVAVGTLQPGSVTPQGTSAIVLSAIVFDGGTTTLSIDSSFAIQDQVQYAAGVNFGVGFAYKSGVTGAENPTWTLSSSRVSAAMSITCETSGANDPDDVTQVKMFGSSGLGTAATGNFIFAGVAAASSQTIPCPMAVALTIRALRMRITTGPGSGKTACYAVYKNDIATGLVLTYNDSETDHTAYLDGGVHFAAGDRFVLVFQGINSPTASGRVRGVFEIVGDTPGQQIFGWGTASDTPTELAPFGAASAAWFTAGTSHESRSLIGQDGTITTLCVRERTAPGGGGTVVYTVYKNGTAQDGSGGTVDTRNTLSGATQQQTVTFSLDVAPDDTISLRRTTTGSPAASTWQTGTLVFVPDADRGIMFCTSWAGASASATEYAPIETSGSSNDWQATEGNVDLYGAPAPMRITSIRVELDAAPGSGKSRTLTVRKNGGDTALVAVVADTATKASGVVTTAIEYGLDDLIDVAQSPSGTPGGTKVRFVLNGFMGENPDPVVQTRPATSITKDAATLRGRIDPNLNDVTGYFIWSTDPDNLSNTTVTTAIGNGDAFVAYSTRITGLTQDTTYYFRAVGDTGESPGLFYGVILSFRTLGEQLFVDGEVSHPLTMLSFIDRNGDRHVYAEVDLNDPSFYEGGYKAPWVLKWITITRGFSDRTGAIEHMVFGATLSDTERFFRALLDDPTNRFLTNRPLWEKMIDDEDRRRLQLWRYVANGYVSDYEPKSPLQFEITGCDWLKKKFSRKARAQRAWQPTITLEDFPTCPKDNVGLAAPLIYGSVADDQAGVVGPVAGGPVIIPITGGVPGGYWPYSLGIGGPESGTEWAPPGGFSTPNPAIDADHRSFCELPNEGSPSSVPTNPVAAAISGGSLRDDWRSATRIIGFMVTAIHSGVESDPSPVAVADLDTYGGERTCRASWTAAAGGADGGYNVYFTDSPFFVDIKMSTKMAPYIVSSNFVRVLHVGSGTTTVDFTSETDGSEHSWDNQYLYNVSAILSDGSESPPSGIILGLSSPYPRPLHLRWLPYTGAIGYRIRRSPVLGVDVPPSWDRSYDVGSTGAFGPKTIDGITQYEFCDDFTDSPPGTTVVTIGTQGAIRTPKGEIKPIYVGDVTIGGQTKPTFLVARGACLNVCRSAFAKDTLIPESEYGSTIFAPGHSGWPASDSFVDINGRRYSLIQLDGTRASNAIDGTEPLTINVDGFEDIGDGTGELITSLPMQEKHFVRNFLAPDSPPDQEWLTQCETFAHEPTLTLVDESTFDDVEAIWNEINAGSPTSGIEGAFVIGANGEFVTALEVLARFHVSGDWNGTFTRKGQYAVSMEPVELPIEPVEIDDVVNINQDSFAIRDQVATEFFNILPYAHTEDYAQRTESGWYSIEEGEVDVRDAASIINYDQERESPRFDLFMLRNRSTLGASAIQVTMQRKLARYRHPLRTAVMTIPLSGTQIEVGDIFRATHIEGIGAQGWIGRYVRATRHELDPNQDRVRLEVYDVETLILGTSP